YNAQFDAQKDDDFGKEAYRLSALRTPPFYGCWFGGSMLTTLDGLRINKDCQVLDADDQVIDGLYAAGDVSGSFFSGNYPEYIVGCASGRTSTQGRHVARFLPAICKRLLSNLPSSCEAPPGGASRAGGEQTVLVSLSPRTRAILM
ncbi:MAG: FAD-binding protein, partial [Eggerthellaceae bacterium]